MNLSKNNTHPDAVINESDGFLEEAEKTFDWKEVSIEGWICLPIFWILAAVVFWQFFTRYFLNDSAVWTEELARQLLILLTFFGTAYALTTRSHIAISFFIQKISGRPRKWIEELTTLLQFLFYAYGAILCIDIAEATKFQMLMSFDLSKSVVYQAVALSLAIMALRSAIDIYRIFNSYRSKLRNKSNASALKQNNNKEGQA